MDLEGMTPEEQLQNILKQKEELLALQQFNKITAEIERLRKDEKILFYNKGPVHLKQMEFHKDNHRIRCIFGGNRTGKSCAGAVEAVWYATGTHPYKKIEVPNDGWVVSLTNDVQRDVAQREILRWLPKRLINQRGIRVRDGRKDDLEKAIIDILPLTNGSTISFKSEEQGRGKFQGTSRRWCIAEGQRVFMSDGTYKPIEDVKIGDSVVTINKCGNYVNKKVLKVYDNGIKEVIKLNTGRYLDLECTPDHMVYNGLDSKIEAENADKIYQARLGWKPENTQNKDDAYYVWTGLVLSEGCTSQKKITMGNEGVVNKAISYLPSGARVRKTTFKNGHVPDWRLYWNEFWDITKNVLADKKRVPNWIFTSSNEKISLFLRYLFAGDGWASNHIIGYASTSKILTEDVSLLLWRLGIRSTIVYKKSQNKNWKNQWWVHISASDYVKKFIEDIGIEGKEDKLKDVLEIVKKRISNKVKRGYTKIETQNPIFKRANDNAKNRYTRIKSKDKIGFKHVYDLSIEDYHRYFIGTSLLSNCWFDEELNEKGIYDECLMRLMDKRGDAWITMTPLLGLSWTYDTIYINEIKNPNIRYWTMSWEDNPFLSQEEVAEQIQNMPEEEREARQYGKFVSVSGLVYKEFREELHVIDPITIPKGWYDNISIDPGLDAPLACTFYACDGDGTVYVIAEHYEAGKGIDYHAEKIWGIAKDLGWPLGFNGKLHALIDSAANQKTLAAERSVAELFRDYKIICNTSVDKDVWTGIQRVKSYLKLRPPLDVDVWPRGKPKLFIFRTCPNAIREIKSYRWKPPTDNNPNPDAPVKKNDHFMDNLRYYIMSKPDIYVGEKQKLTGEYHYQELKLMGYTDSAIERMARTPNSGLRVIGR